MKILSKTSFENHIKLILSNKEKLIIDINDFDKIPSSCIISEIEYEELKSLVNNFLIKKKALSFLARREHSYFELQQKLLKNFKFDNIKQALDRLQNQNLLSDERFSIMYLNHLQNKKYGIRQIKYKLQQKGISQEIINNLDIKESCKTISLLIEKKLKTLKNEPLAKQKQKLFNFLSYKGFTSSKINQALNKYF